MRDFEDVEDQTKCPDDGQFDRYIRLIGAVIWQAIIDASPYCVRPANKQKTIRAMLKAGWLKNGETDDGYVMIKPRRNRSQEAAEFIEGCLTTLQFKAVSKWWKNPVTVKPNLRLGQLPPDLDY